MKKAITQRMMASYLTFEALIRWLGGPQ